MCSSLSDINWTLVRNAGCRTHHSPAESEALGVQFSRSVVSNSLRPHGPQHARPSVHRQLAESTQTHIRGVGDAVGGRPCGWLWSRWRWRGTASLLRLQAWAPSLRLPSLSCLLVSTHCPSSPAAHRPAGFAWVQPCKGYSLRVLKASYVLAFFLEQLLYFIVIR